MNVLAVSVTERGRRLAEQLPYQRTHGDAAVTIRSRWPEVDGLVLFLAVGAAVRIIAPLLADKHRDPAVVCVDESGGWVVSLVGGHGGGANALARTVAAHLDAQAVITTATDSLGTAAADLLPGFSASGDVATVTTALLDGRRVEIVNRQHWPLPRTWPPKARPHPGDSDARTSDGAVGADAGTSDSAVGADAGTSDSAVGPGAGAEMTVVITDETVAAQPGVAVLRPPSLVIGIGTSTGAVAAEVSELIAETLTANSLDPAAVAEVATIDRRATHPSVLALGLPVRSFSPEQLAGVMVPNPSDVVDSAVGTPSVAEAAALLAAGPGARLVVPKQAGKRGTATVAVARRLRPRPRLTVVGLGPGGPALRTAAAEAAIRGAETVIGFEAYIEQCRDLLHPGQEVLASPIGDEILRAKQALSEAAQGRVVAVVCSGDAGVYGMASLVFELAGRDDPPTANRADDDGAGDDALGAGDIEVVPGVTAALAAAAILGAPLGHDHAAISLSDLLTPWPVIEARLRAVAAADLVTSLYNPRSRQRHWQLDAARTIFLEHRSESTPVGVVTDAGRRTQSSTLTTLVDLDPSRVGMTTTVVIGSTTTRVVDGRMVTPRGYQP